MKTIAVAVLVLFALTQMSVAVFDYIGANDKYSPAMKSDFQTYMSSNAPEAGLLEFSCFFWEDYVSMSAIIDNTTNPNGAGTLAAGLFTYMNHHSKVSYPERAEIDVKDSSGKFIGSGVVYAKWVDDYFQNRKINETDAWYVLRDKFAGTVKE